MNWFLVALVAPAAHAAVNHLDKHLISKYFAGGQVGSLTLFSALFAGVALPFIGWFHPEVFAVRPMDAFLLMVSGALIVFAYILYFYALEKDEASFVVPLFQMVPVLGFGISYVMLGETISLQQAAAGALIIFGSLLLSLDFAKHGVRLKHTVFWLMVGSSFLYAVNAALFKFVAVHPQAFWPSLFWDFTGKVAIGIALFLVVARYRRQFIAVLKENSAKVLGLNGANELLALLGEAATSLAVLLAPITLVQVVGGFQPAFVFVYGILLTKFFPRFGSESLSRQRILQKMVGILIIISGSALLVLV